MWIVGRTRRATDERPFSVKESMLLFAMNLAAVGLIYSAYVTSDRIVMPEQTSGWMGEIYEILTAK